MIPAAAPMRSPTADPIVEEKRVVCSRCGGLMWPEALFTEARVGGIPLLRWRCDIGHVTQALPIPDALRASIPSREVPVFARAVDA